MKLTTTLDRHVWVDIYLGPDRSPRPPRADTLHLGTHDLAARDGLQISLSPTNRRTPSTYSNRIPISSTLTPVDNSVNNWDNADHDAEASRGLRKPDRLSRYVWSNWGLQLLSWSTSALCMALILAMLLYLNRKPLSRWKLGLNPNTYLSIISRVAASAIIYPVSECIGQLKWNWFLRKPKKLLDFELFDRATRGPVGSFMFITYFKARWVNPWNDREPVCYPLI